MSPTIGASLQVVFVDALFLCLAAGLAFWFRAWLKEQQKGMDQRLDGLEEQQQALARICDRLTNACKSLERPSPAVDAITRSAPRPEPAPAPSRPFASGTPASAAATGGQGRPPVAADGGPGAGVPVVRRRVDTPLARADRQWEELTDRSREAYRRARDLLEQGVPPNDIARQVGLGVAEVNVLKRMRDAGRR
ncbi:MAG: hypothetical protein O2782_00085 [bacterium]|nr:hypothetical protein [bacterium]